MANLSVSANVDALMQSADYAAFRALLTLDTGDNPEFTSVIINEKAAQETAAAGKGEYWIKNDTPCVPYFTDDGGTDYLLVTLNADAYVSSAAASGAITATTYLNVLANATITDAGETDPEFTIDDTNKRITYTGTKTILVLANATVGFISSKSNEIARFRIAKNGTTDVASEMGRKIGTGADEGALALQATETMAQNDYLELWATLDASSSDTITVNHCNFSVRALH